MKTPKPKKLLFAIAALFALVAFMPIPTVSQWLALSALAFLFIECLMPEEMRNITFGLSIVFAIVCLKTPIFSSTLISTRLGEFGDWLVRNYDPILYRVWIAFIALLAGTITVKAILEVIRHLGGVYKPRRSV
jgi:hypothetical protein